MAALTIHIDDLEADALVLDGDSIMNQISPILRGEAGMRERPSDVRLILKTAPTGEEYSFPNYGHPDNEMSTVKFDGTSGIMIMPEGETARKQIFSAQQIVARLGDLAKTGVTPEFMQQEIINPNGLCHRFAAQAYGPAPFDTQADRLVEAPLSAGSPETFSPLREPGYALGMRAATSEEAFIVLYSGAVENMFVKGAKQAATALSSIEDAIPASLNGTHTTKEALDGLNRVTMGIVLAVDAGTGNTKPIRLETAKDIFNLQTLPWIFVDKAGKVIDQRIEIPLTPPNP